MYALRQDPCMYIYMYVPTYACMHVRTCILRRVFVAGCRSRTTLTAHTQSQNSLENILSFVRQKSNLRVRVQPVYSGRLGWKRFRD